MRKTIRLGFIPLLLLAVTAIRCSETCTVTSTTHYWEPVYMTMADMRASVKSMEPHELKSPGKIYFKDNFLYINEVGKGIHVIDNTNPSMPVAKSFINIPGNFDLAIRNNILFADSYVDLVAIDISQVGQEQEVARKENVFQTYSTMRFTANQMGVIADLKEVKNVYSDEPECNYSYMPGGWRWFGGMIAVEDAAMMSASSFAAPKGNTTGTAGSLARFAVREDYLYALDQSRLKVIDVATTTSITTKTDVEIAWDIETIFPVNDKLFIGSQSGMHIFDLAAPASPVKLSTYAHVRSCDPVVVSGDFAYVTLRNGSACAGFVNQLEIINVKDLTSPYVVRIYPMTNPHGLGVDGNTLFICDGRDGLKVFDATDKMQIASLAHYKDLTPIDVIPLGGVAMVISESGLSQYDYSDIKNIKLLSTIEIASVQ
jgi:hypothetical protein